MGGQQVALLFSCGYKSIQALAQDSGRIAITVAQITHQHPPAIR